jgi:hypothetical protein
MNKRMKYFWLALPLLALAACDDDGPDGEESRALASNPATLRIVHASADAPAVEIDVRGQTVATNVDYKAVSDVLTVPPGATAVSVRGILPGTARPTVIGPANLDLGSDRRYLLFALNNVASIEPLLLQLNTEAVAAGSTRLRVLHAAPNAPRVSVFVTAPGANLASSAPVGSFAFKENLGPTSVPAGDYQIRVTPAGATAPVVFDSGTVRLEAGADLTIAAVPNTTTGTSPVSLLVIPPTGRAEILDRATPAGVRVVHASPDTPAVQVVVNDNFAAPLVPNLAFPNFTPFVNVPAATYNVKVTPVGNNGLIAINANLPLTAGVENTVLAVGRLASIEPLVLTDNRRRIATQAKVRIVHASPTAGNVDIYVVAPGTALTTATPAFANVAFKANTGYVNLAAGTYSVAVTPTGSKTPAIGPADITVSNNRVYTAIARDASGGGTPLGLILLDDFVAP